MHNVTQGVLGRVWAKQSLMSALFSGGHLKKIFRTYPKNFPDYDIFLGNNTNFPEIT
jgi:hypothetical protein